MGHPILILPAAQVAKILDTLEKDMLASDLEVISLDKTHHRCLLTF